MNIVTMIQQSILLSAHYVHLHKKQRYGKPTSYVFSPIILNRTHKKKKKKKLL